MSSIANLSDSNDERYEANLARRRAKTEALLREQEEKEQLECQARKEAKIAEWRRLEEELQKKAEEEEAQRIAMECQKDLAHHLEADCIATIKQQRHKN